MVHKHWNVIIEYSLWPDPDNEFVYCACIVQRYKCLRMFSYQRAPSCFFCELCFLGLLCWFLHITKRCICVPFSCTEVVCFFLSLLQVLCWLHHSSISCWLECRKFHAPDAGILILPTIGASSCWSELSEPHHAFHVSLPHKDFMQEPASSSTVMHLTNLFQASPKSGASHFPEFHSRLHKC